MSNRTGPVKRVTIWVRDIERSLALYRDILKLSIVEDKSLSGSAMAKMVGYETCSMRIVHLTAGDSDHGWIGLYAVSDAVPAVNALDEPRKDRVSYGQTTIVLQSDELDAIVAELEARKYEFLLRPTTYVKPTDSPKFPAGHYTETVFFDPDGVTVSILGYRPLSTAAA